MLSSCHIDRIIIGQNRQRKQFDVGSITDLANDIAKFGLLHPPVVRGDGAQLILVAGERRLRALAELCEFGTPFRCGGEEFAGGRVPYTLIDSLSEEDYYEAELSENVNRSDLTWQELAHARAALHRLRTKQNPEHTTLDTAKEIFGPKSSYTESVASAIVLDTFLDNPEVAKAGSAREALRVVERIVRDSENTKLAARVGEIESPHKVIVGDWLTVRNSDVPAIDVILTDPPYGMGADEFGDSGGAAAGAHGYRDDAQTFEENVIPGLAKAISVCRPNAHAYVFCDFEKFQRIKILFAEHDWHVFRTPMIWQRSTGRVPIPDFGPRRQYECILFARRGERKVNVIAPDVLSFDSDENLGHSAQKPVALFGELLRRSARPGDWILDPFAGTGTVIVAAHEAKCRAFAVEMNPAAAGIAVTRMRGLDRA